jgi:hypothetical protein
MQIRSVECHDSHGAHNTQCEPSTRPAAVQSCSTGISCSPSESPPTEEFEESFVSDKPELDEGDNFERNDDVTEEEDDDNVRGPKASKGAAKPDVDETEEEEDESDMQGDDPFERHRQIPLAYQYRIPRAERLVDPNAPNEPT